MTKGRTSIVQKSFMQTDKDCFDNKQWFNRQATTNPLLFMNPSIMEAMILKTCNMFKKEDKKEMEKHIRQYDNKSYESLMAKNVITNRPSCLQMSN